MSDAAKRSAELVAEMAALRDGLRRDEAAELLPFYLAGVRIVPSNMVDRTTILVTPQSYAALKAKVART